MTIRAGLSRYFFEYHHTNKMVWCGSWTFLKFDKSPLSLGEVDERRYSTWQKLCCFAIWQSQACPFFQFLKNLGKTNPNCDQCMLLQDRRNLRAGGRSSQILTDLLNPIPTGGQIMPNTLILGPRIFRPSYGSVLKWTNIEFTVSCCNHRPSKWQVEGLHSCRMVQFLCC